MLINVCIIEAGGMVGVNAYESMGCFFYKAQE